MPSHMRISRRATFAITTFGAAILISAAAAAARDPRPRLPELPALDSARLLADISALAADSMEGRRVGTPGGARARAFLLHELTRIGLAPLADSFASPFAIRGRVGGAPELSGVNLLAVVRGTVRADRYIVLSAHYDHLGVRNGEVYNGADDNASGTCAVLAIARWLMAHPPENSVIIALFDAEESGDLGSKAFVANPPVPLARIAADVNLDMVSRNTKGELYAAGGTPNPVLRPLVDSVAALAAVKIIQGHDGAKAGQDDWTQQSDQGAFAVKKIPFMYFGVEDHPDYHRPTDKVDHIDPGFYYHAARAIAEFVVRLDRALDRVATARTS
jgi:hypothetical protein